MGDLDPRDAAATDARFEGLIAASFVVLVPNAQDFVVAKRYLGNYASGLRAPDALHLAVAANNAAETIFTLDRRLVAAGAALGLPMTAGIEEP